MCYYVLRAVIEKRREAIGGVRSFMSLFRCSGGFPDGDRPKGRSEFRAFLRRRQLQELGLVAAFAPNECGVVIQHVDSQTRRLLVDAPTAKWPSVETGEQPAAPGCGGRPFLKSMAARRGRR
ncbi:unnamed protein product [Durusdinium trenchii]|uniref:Uncharacterized protein n=1 Tax=Durusdinium trenchii TaxID=1381693 RepID=A0ABP0RLS6_9DINO